MNVIYRWILTIGETAAEVHPVYKSDLALEYQQESGQKFFRGKLSGKITLVAADADMVIGAPFETEFDVMIQKSADMGLTWVNYYHCHFYKTDCTINEDDRKVEVQPHVIDQYNDVLNGMEKEFNLVELPVAIEPLKAAKRPFFQIYTEGEDIVSCLYGGQYFETDRVNDDVSPYDSGFAKVHDRLEIQFASTTEAGFVAPFIGLWHGLDSGASDLFLNSDNVYLLEYFEYIAGGGGQVYIYYNGLYVRRKSDNSIVWEFKQQSNNGYQNLPSTLTFTPAYDETLPTLSADVFTYSVWGRFILDLETFEHDDAGTPQTITAQAIPADDIAENNRNYKYCVGYSEYNLQQSARYSETPTQWGRNDDGLYFLPPDDGEGWYPVGRSQWVNTSLWLQYDIDMELWEREARKSYIIKDTYPLSSVISVLLAQIAPNITHQDNAAYSKFFYDDSITMGVAGILSGTRAFISQKSNILIGEYQEPAQKAPITLKTVFDMLAKVYGCYWYIDSSNRLVIEHISWFKNGGSYSTSPSIGYDLTSLENLPNGKKWAFATSEYQYDKEDMPTRYQFSWMDDVTDMFKGKPINILSSFVKENKVEDVTIANFTSDLDFMLITPESCSKDGFALFQAQLQIATQVPVIPFGYYYIGVVAHWLQNFIVSMYYAQGAFLLYDMPSWDIEVNGEETTSNGIQRNKKQTITFPIGANDPDLNQLVKTYLGNGQFDKVSINLSSRTAKVTIKYNTYDNE